MAAGAMIGAMGDGLRRPTVYNWKDGSDLGKVKNAIERGPGTRRKKVGW